jgi:hypothetical protein
MARSIFARARLLALPALVCAATAAVPRSAFAAGNERLVLKVTDRDTGKPLAVRMHLKNSKGVAVKVLKVPYWKDHFAFDGEITLELPRGSYTFELERGGEYLERTGHFTIEAFANDTKTVDMKRFIDMSKNYWFSGDLHVHRAPQEIELLMRSEDLHIAPVVTWQNKFNYYTRAKQRPPAERLVRFDDNRFYYLMAGEDDRKAGALGFVNLPRPLAVDEAGAEFPPSMEFIRDALVLGKDDNQAKELGPPHLDVQRIFSWDFPVWLAAGRVDSVELAFDHLHRSGVQDNEGTGYARDRTLFAAPWGTGRWSQMIYYHALNCGFKLPPSAGSGSGVAPNPLGYNRVYVQVDGALTWEKWFAGLRAGRSMVTNGPLLIPSVEGQMPGFTFSGEKGKTLELEIGCTLSTRDKIDYLEVVQNGRVASEVRLDAWKQAKGRLPNLKFDRSGWFLIRAVTTVRDTYRFASTAPYYVAIGEQKQISRTSAEFFLDWVKKRKTQVKLPDEKQQAALMAQYDAAEKFWADMVKQANAE